MNSTFAALYTRFSPFPWSVRLRVTRWLSGAIYALSGVIGAAAFLYPFFLRAQGQVYNSGSTLVLTTGLLMLCLLVLLLEIQGQVISAKLVAALGLLVAVTAILRFVDNAVPIPGGFSPIFAPIIMAGYVFGPRFGPDYRWGWPLVTVSDVYDRLGGFDGGVATADNAAAGGPLFTGPIRARLGVSLWCHHQPVCLAVLDRRGNPELATGEYSGNNGASLPHLLHPHLSVVGCNGRSG